MDSTQPASLGQLTPAQPSQMATKRPRWSRTDRKAGRPSRKQIAGWLNWYNRLTRSGALAEAAEFHRKHGLHRYGATVPTVPTADTATGTSATDTASHGGAGVSQRHGRENWDKTTQATQNLQLQSATALPLAVEADLTRLAAKADCTPTVTPPAGESEGERGFCQQQSISGANLGGELVSVWPKVGEGIVGRLCRNKQYNELRVVGEDGKEMWTKVGNWQFRTGLIRGERVLVRKIWGSGDDTDAEYEVVKRLDVNEPAEEHVPQPELQPESVAPVVVDESAVREQQTPEASSDAQQPPVAILPQFRREEPDYPRKPESGEDYIARIRAEAAMWANGQGR